MRTPITVAYVSGLARDFEHTDLSKVSIREEQVYFCAPDSKTLGLIEDELGRTPDGVPFASRKEAEEWLKAWVGKEIAKLQDKIKSYNEGLHVALGHDVDSIDDGVHG